MDPFSGRTVADERDGYALIEHRRSNHPAVGDSAPDFELARRDGQGRVRLSSFWGQRPVVLIFASIT